jgi:hypothetical protein
MLVHICFAVHMQEQDKSEMGQKTVDKQWLI